MSTSSYFLAHLADGLRRPVPAADLFVAVARGHRTELRLADREPWMDVRPLVEIERRLEAHGFLRIHREHLVHPSRIYEIRKRGPETREWEVKLEPPVNAVLPVSRTRLAALWAAFGE